MSEEAVTGKTITIDGKTYPIDAFSEQARAQVINIQYVDQEMKRLEQQLAIHRAARLTYARLLQDELANITPTNTQ